MYEILKMLREKLFSQDSETNTVTENKTKV